MVVKQLWHLNHENTVIKSLDLEPQPDIVFIQSKYSMLSTGTERLVSRGQVPTTMYERMKVPFQLGDFSFPLSYGYSLVGIDQSTGDFVHIMHPHANACLIPAIDRSRLFKIQDPIQHPRYALISNLETIINAIWDADLTTNDRVVIFGGGNIGLLLAITIKNQLQIEPVVIEQDDTKIQLLHSLGFETTVADDLSFTKAFNTTSQASCVNNAFELLEEEGTLIELSWYGTHPASLNLGMDFHYKRLKYISSQVSTIPKKKRDEESYASRKQQCFEMLQKGWYDGIIKSVPFADAPRIFEQLRKGSYIEARITVLEY